MKKFVSIILALAIFLSVGFTSIFYTQFAERNKENSAATFSAEMSSLAAEYNGKNDILSRIIIGSSMPKNTYGAVKAVGTKDITVLQYGSILQAQSALKSLIKDGYDDAQIDAEAQCADAPTPENADLWGSEVTESASAIGEIAASQGEYSEVTIGVMDTGADTDCEFIKDRLVELKKNFSASGTKNSAEDDNGHGTQVSGVIVQNTASNVKIKPYKVFDKNGKSTNSLIISALNFIASESEKPDIINMSFSISSVTENLTRDRLTNQLISSGVTIVASAGNNAVNAKYYYPANIKNAITVSASGRNNRKTAFSNYGDIVDIAAPGVDIFTCTLNGKYTYVDGTSFSAPAVASAAALLLSKNPSYKCGEVCSVLQAAAMPVYEWFCDVEWCGAGILNFANLISDEEPETPQYSVSSGKYNRPVELEITSADSSAEIVYTTDLTAPSKTNGTVYEKPLEISRDTHIIAVALTGGRRSNYASSTYEIISDEENDFTVKSDGTLVSYNGDKQNITVPEQVDGITVTSIGEKAFEQSGITSVSLPSTVTEIEENAFRASSISSLTAEGVTTVGDTAFYDCKGLFNLNMPKLVSAGKRAFYNCTLLSSVDFGDSIETLGDYAFASSGLSNAVFPKLTEAKSAFKDSKIIVANLPLLKNIDGTFCGCSLLSDVKIPGAVTISDNAFKDTPLVTTLALNNVETIDDYGLNCSSVKYINVPKCTYIGANAFYQSECLYIN